MILYYVCMHIPAHDIYCLPINQLTNICMSSIFDYYEQCFYEHLCTRFCVDMFSLHFHLSWVYIFRSGITDSYGNFIFNFWEMSKCFPNQLSNITFTNNIMRVPSTPSHYLLGYSHPRSVKWYLIVVLVWNSLMGEFSNDAEHLLKCSSIQSLYTFLMRLLIFFLSCKGYNSLKRYMNFK
jgi:hypothetical protein